MKNYSYLNLQILYVSNSLNFNFVFFSINFPLHYGLHSTLLNLGYISGRSKHKCDDHTLGNDRANEKPKCDEESTR